MSVHTKEVDTFLKNIKAGIETHRGKDEKNKNQTLKGYCETTLVELKHQASSHGKPPFKNSQTPYANLQTAMKTSTKVGQLMQATRDLVNAEQEFAAFNQLVLSIKALQNEPGFEGVLKSVAAIKGLKENYHDTRAKLGQLFDSVCGRLDEMQQADKQLYLETLKGMLQDPSILQYLPCSAKFCAHACNFHQAPLNQKELRSLTQVIKNEILDIFKNKKSKPLIKQLETNQRVIALTECYVKVVRAAKSNDYGLIAKALQQLNNDPAIQASGSNRMKRILTGDITSYLNEKQEDAGKGRNVKIDIRGQDFDKIHRDILKSIDKSWQPDKSTLDKPNYTASFQEYVDKVFDKLVEETTIAGLFTDFCKRVQFTDEHIEFLIAVHLYEQITDDEARQAVFSHMRDYYLKPQEGGFGFSQLTTIADQKELMANKNRTVNVGDDTVKAIQKIEPADAKPDTFQRAKNDAAGVLTKDPFKNFSEIAQKNYGKAEMKASGLTPTRSPFDGR